MRCHALWIGLLVLTNVASVFGVEPPTGWWTLTYTFRERERHAVIDFSLDEKGQLQALWRGSREPGELDEVSLQDGTLRFVRRTSWRGRDFGMIFEGKSVDADHWEGTLIMGDGESPATLVRIIPGEAAKRVGGTEPIRLNSLGYLPDAPKVATVAQAAESFQVVNTDTGQAVHEGRLIGPQTNGDTGEELYTADFSAVTEPGTYQLTIEGVGQSPRFEVAPDVYNEALRVATTAMYLWRCGIAVHGEHDGHTFAHEACHTEDAWGDEVGLGHARVETTGGWHDAGDYNKYVTNAGITVGAMLLAWERYSDKLEAMRLPIPESGGDIPDFLAELKWELDWLLKMQQDDGQVYHKVSTLNFGGFIMPEDEAEPRYLAPAGTTAAADLTAMAAQASRLYRPYDAAYADRLLEAAIKSYGYLQQQPEHVRADLSAFSTGGYDSDDADERLWAAAELWETTGEQPYLDDLEARLQERQELIETAFDWSNVGNLGVFTYLESQRPGRDPALVQRVTQSLIDAADNIVTTTGEHGYARGMGEAYWWGVNGAVARQTLVLTIANDIQPNDAYRRAGLDCLHHLFGRNVYGRSFVTGLGHRPPIHPHDRRSGGDENAPTWPGYLVGGAHPMATDWNDEQADFATNEIAINWNGALIYALAAYADDFESN